MYNLAAMETALSGSIFSGKLHFSPVTGSTNSDAVAAARAGAPHGSVYFADEQLAGRGRGDHLWHSDAGVGLYVSVVVRLALSAERASLLSLAAGLAAIDAIRAASGLKADLRWPNDVLIGERKTAGILVESKIEESMLAFAVVGIGVNVHQRSFEPSLATPATSLDVETGRWINRQTLLIALLKALEQETLSLGDSSDASTIPARLEQASTWVRGRAVEVHGPQACNGVTSGLSATGFLLVQTSDGLIEVRTGGIRAVK
jgi:BirA family transcriptional regulator, biotin operon repressor / biotin---[acetyl-CoA-carboxylase] ligase